MACKPARSNPEHLAFIDETWAKTNMARLFGRAPRGQRLVAPVPHGHWMRTTFVALLRHDEITAPCVLDGPLDGVSFLTYVERFLAPALRPGDVVVMDNLASHITKSLASKKQSSGPARHCAICQPIVPTSTRSNKPSPTLRQAALRKAAARTFDALIQAIASALASFTPQECANYLANSCYRRRS
jgi:hypothetical protein